VVVDATPNAVEHGELGGTLVSKDTIEFLFNSAKKATAGPPPSTPSSFGPKLFFNETLV
jgi:hypothetical protein